MHEYGEQLSFDRHLARLQQYKEVISKLFPALKKRVLDTCSILPADALFLGRFLDLCPSRVMALEVGVGAGASTLCFAGHPKVSRVTSVNPNPELTEELATSLGTWLGEENAEALKGFGMLDIARAAIKEFPEAREKVDFLEGLVVDTPAVVEGKSPEVVARVEVPVVETSDDDKLIVLIQGLYTRESVRETLKVIFERNPLATVFLDDCRRKRGLFVQAGVADFIERTKEPHRFSLVGDLGPALATSNLGVVYSGRAADETERILEEVGREFSRKLDPLRLLDHEAELIDTVSRLSRQLSRATGDKLRLEEQVSRIEERDTRLTAQITKLRNRNDRLLSRYSGRRYKLADALAERVLWLLALRRILREKVSSFSRK